MATFIIATRNPHKVGEIQAILGKQHRYLSLRDFPQAPTPVEDAPTFEGNAVKKARSLADWIGERRSDLGPLASLEPKDGVYVLADDSGLEVDALGGAPGVHSARFAALDTPQEAGHENSSDADNNAKLLRLLAKVPMTERQARFRCVLAMVEVLTGEDMAVPAIFEGSCEGHIGFHPRGEGGFGYDPLFFPRGREQSFAELGEAIKNQLSHRAQALEGLHRYLRTLDQVGGE